MEPATDHPARDVLARAEQALERGDYLACGRLVRSLTRERLNHDHVPSEVVDRARDLEARLAPDRVSWITGTICAVLLAGIFIHYVIPW